MFPNQHVGAVAPSLAAPERPTSDNAPCQARVGERRKAENGYFRSIGLAEQAVATLEGEQHADAYLRRLQANAVQPGELAVLMSFLTGEMLHGACRVIEKALRRAGAAA